MTDSFILHPQLARDALAIGDLHLCRVLLMNDRRFPWLILVPRREGLCELFELAPPDYPLVMNEVRQAARHFARLTEAHKMNIAALGNQVKQLHIHIVARFASDAAWPAPVWNSGPAEPYAAAELEAYRMKIRHFLGIA